MSSAALVLVLRDREIAAGGRATMTANAVLDVMGEADDEWWRSLSRRELLALYTAADDTYYHAHYVHTTPPDDRPYAEVQPAYVLGHIAGFSPQYSGRTWQEIEPELATVWPSFSQTPWADVAIFAGVAFRRAAAAQAETWRAHLGGSDGAWNAA